MRRGDERRGREERRGYRDTNCRAHLHNNEIWFQLHLRLRRGRARTYAHVVDVFALSIGDGEDAYGGDDEEVE